MLALALYLVTLVSPVAARCEEHGPRLDGTYVTICNGSVTRVRDGLGNVRDFDPATGTIVVEDGASPPMLLPR